MRDARSSTHLLLVTGLLLTGAAFAADAPLVEAQPHQHLDSRHGHNRSYIDHGVVVNQTPRDAVVVRKGSTRYWFDRGVWYRPTGDRYSVVAAPIGVFVRVLPSSYTTLRIRGLPYYYANDTYYLWREDNQAYEVVETPPGADAATVDAPTPPGGDGLFVYPNNAQTQEQQARDRYQCHLWSTQQTGFDPSADSANVSPQQTREKRADYLRAMSACLTGRGYTVR
jgi:hypothetical protein